MPHTIKFKKGFDINIVGKPERKVIEVEQPETFALKPTDFKGMDFPKMMVKEGETVKAGTPILFDKSAEDIKYCSPVSGEVAEIVRGAKRKILEIRILADKKVAFESFKKHSVSDISSLSRENAVEQMTSGGVWPNIIQRPFGVVANSAANPKAIFISGFDSHPLAPDLNYQVEGEEQSFQAGITILKKLTDGKVHLTLRNGGEIAQAFSQTTDVELNKVSGPHPAGNVGTHIHHIDPINKGDVVWAIDPIGVIQIGRLFLEGKYDTSRLIALTGSEVESPAYVKTYSGACIGKILASSVSGSNLRYISGNVLTGEAVAKDGYLGFYHHQITVIPEGDQEEFMGWLLPSTNKLSFHKAFGLLGSPKKEYVVNTNTYGEHRNFTITGAFEKIMPMDILPAYLFKSIIANDYDEMEALGIYELIEEDVALCEFIDVSKNEIQKILRDGIELIRNS